VRDGRKEGEKNNQTAAVKKHEHRRRPIFLHFRFREIIAYLSARVCRGDSVRSAEYSIVKKRSSKRPRLITTFLLRLVRYFSIIRSGVTRFREIRFSFLFFFAQSLRLCTGLVDQYVRFILKKQNRSFDCFFVTGRGAFVYDPLLDRMYNITYALSRS